MSNHPQPGDLPPETPRPDPTAPPPSTPGSPADRNTPGGPGAAPVPPVNYAPPGYTPDYGAPYPPSPPADATYAPGDYTGPPHPGAQAYPGAQAPGAQIPGAQAYPGYPGYPAAPSPYPGYPAPPPRKSNTPLIAVIIAVALLLCGGVATTGILIAHNIKARADRAVKLPTAPGLPTDVPTLPGLPTDIPNLPGLPTALPTGGTRQITVTYQVTGEGPAEILYVADDASGPSQLHNVKLPWRFTTKMQTPALLSVVAIPSDVTADHQITCQALVDGKEVKKNSTDSGTFSTAACTYFALG